MSSSEDEANLRSLIETVVMRSIEECGISLNVKHFQLDSKATISTGSRRQLQSLMGLRKNSHPHVWEVSFDVVAMVNRVGARFDLPTVLASSLNSPKFTTMLLCADNSENKNENCISHVLEFEEVSIILSDQGPPLDWSPTILMPFSPGDYSSLGQSVKEFGFPLRPYSSQNPELTVKLVFAFSRNLDDFPDAVKAVTDVSTAVKAQKEPWTRYFNPEVQIINCNNTDAEDIYDPTLQGKVDEFGDPVRWVGGPNLQFQKMMRWMIENIPNGIVFMKEFDTVPQVDNHFGNLLAEIERNQPVYMLGR